MQKKSFWSDHLSGRPLSLQDEQFVERVPDASELPVRFAPIAIQQGEDLMQSASDCAAAAAALALSFAWRVRIPHSGNHWPNQQTVVPVPLDPASGDIKVGNIDVFVAGGNIRKASLGSPRPLCAEFSHTEE